MNEQALITELALLPRKAAGGGRVEGREVTLEVGFRFVGNDPAWRTAPPYQVKRRV